MRIYIKLFFIFIFIFTTSSNAKDNYFDQAKKPYENKKNEKSKIFLLMKLIF